MKRLLLALFLLSAPAILGAPYALTNALRVRAFTEAGTGEYPEPVRATAGTSRRRAAR
jgi:hypothetical protein